METPHTHTNIDWDALWEKQQPARDSSKYFRNIRNCVIFSILIAFCFYFWVNQPFAQSRNGNFTVVVTRKSGKHFKEHFICEVWQNNNIFASEDVVYGDTIKPDSAQIIWTGQFTCNIVFNYKGSFFDKVAVDLRKPKKQVFKYRYS